MSLDVYLEDGDSTPQGSGIFVREDGQTREISRAEWDEKFPGREPIVAEVDRGCWYNGNITHNLTTMADAAGIYKPLWRPDEIGIERAAQLIAPLETGLAELRSNPEKYKAHNPPNGWGDYDGLVRFVSEYLDACKANPNCSVRVWR